MLTGFFSGECFWAISIIIDNEVIWKSDSSVESLHTFYVEILLSATYTFAAYETFKTKTGFTPEITSGTLESPADLSTPEEMREVVEMGEMIEMVEMVNVPLAPPEPSIVTSEVL